MRTRIGRSGESRNDRADWRRIGTLGVRPSQPGDSFLHSIQQAGDPLAIRADVLSFQRSATGTHLSGRHDLHNSTRHISRSVRNDRNTRSDLAGRTEHWDIRMLADISIQTPNLTSLIDSLSSLSTLVIAAAFAVHIFAFLILWTWWRRDLRSIASSLDDFTRGIKHRSVMDSHAHLSDQIEAFLSDVRDVLDSSNGTGDRQTLHHRMSILDEKRRYLSSMFFETSYNICRTMIEAYPLAGVLGTILAMGAALQLNADSDTSSAISSIVSHFGDAIWSTFAGLAAAILLMFLNSILETSFLGLVENRRHVRDTVVRAKRELAFANGGKAAP